MENLKVGDKVRIINYGSKIFSLKIDYEEMTKRINQTFIPLEYKLMYGTEMSQESINNIAGEKRPRNLLAENQHYWIWDLDPQLVGKEGIIKEVSEVTGKYAIDGIKGKHAWYNNDQLELIK